MTKQEIVNKALSNIAKKRAKAFDKCEKTLAKLRKDDKWQQNETALRIATVERVMAKNESERSAACKKQAQCYNRQLVLLEKHKLTEDDLKPRFACRHCQDTGVIDGEPCKCLQREVRQILSTESDVINKDFTFANSTEKNKHNVSVYKRAEKACEAPHENILFLGNTGLGKTYLLTACVNKCVELGKTALFTTAYGLNSSFLECHLADARTKQLITESLVSVDVLAIDDFGTEQNYKNVTAEYLFVILNERLARRKQTFISTNLSLADLRDKYDERIFSRLLDKNVTFVAQLAGEDKRIGL